MKFLNAALLALSLLCPLLPGVATAGYEEGVAAYNKDDFATALREWRPLADQGNADAQLNLGGMFENGQGVEQDLKEALRLYRLAADQGNVAAQSAVGWMYKDGKGVAKDEKEALKWFHLVGDRGGDDMKNMIQRLENMESSPHQDALNEGTHFGFIFWIVLIALISVPAFGLLPAFIAKNKGRNFILWWVYGTVLFFVAFIHSLLLKEDSKFTEAKALAGGGRKCPYCAEIVKAEAVVCRFCHKDLPPPKFSGKTGLYS